jgi:hypothetical protein
MAEGNPLVPQDSISCCFGVGYCAGAPQDFKFCSPCFYFHRYPSHFTVCSPCFGKTQDNGDNFTCVPLFLIYRDSPSDECLITPVSVYYQRKNSDVPWYINCVFPLFTECKTANLDANVLCVIHTGRYRGQHYCGSGPFVCSDNNELVFCLFCGHHEHFNCCLGITCLSERNIYKIGCCNLFDWYKETTEIRALADSSSDSGWNQYVLQNQLNQQSVTNIQILCCRSETYYGPSRQSNDWEEQKQRYLQNVAHEPISIIEEGEVDNVH